MLSEHMKPLRDYLERTGTTQVAFAERVGVSQPTVSDWVNGENFATAVMLKRIAREIGVTVDDLLADDEPVRSRSRVVGRHIR